MEYLLVIVKGKNVDCCPHSRAETEFVHLVTAYLPNILRWTVFGDSI